MPPAPRLPESVHTEQAAAALRRGDTAAARAAVEALTREHALSPRAWLTASQLLQALGDVDGLLAASQRALALAPHELSAVLRGVEAWIFVGRVDAARALLDGLSARARGNPALLAGLAVGYQQCEQHRQAHDCHAEACRIRPEDPALIFNWATSCVTMGELAQAETLLHRLIAQHPRDFGAHHQLAQLRPWSAEENHVDRLRSLLGALPADHAGRVPLGHALAKELEDLGDDAASWRALAEAAALRRRSLAYRVEDDVAVMARLQESPASSAAAQSSGFEQRSVSGALPIFVLGLPRSGSTLVDRILSAHSQVGSLGEVNDFAFALMRQLGPVRSKLDAIDRASALPPAPLGQSYRAATASRGMAKPWQIDKLPQNFLYIGLIRRALPEARIVHVRRHPLDVCFAMFKTLFRMGYPFSYSLEDLGAYYLAYHQLMAHWRESGAGLIDVDYEALVDDLSGTAQNLLQACGLPWEAACADFSRNAAPTATASAAQVRRPIYRSSLGRWRAHAEQLAPLADFLERHGVSCA